MFPLFIVAAILAFIFGMSVAPIITAANTLIHKVSSEQMRGKVFSYLEVVMHFAFLVTMLLSSSLAEFVNRLWFLVSVGVIFIIIGLTGFFLYKIESYVYK